MKINEHGLRRRSFHISAAITFAAVIYIMYFDRFDFAAFIIASIASFVAFVERFRP